MDKAGLEAVLRAAAEAQGAGPGSAKAQKRGKASLSLRWLRPEPVVLRGDVAGGVLVLEDYLPFVVAGGKLHRRVKAFVAARQPAARLIIRNGQVSLAMPAGGDWAAALAALLALAREVSEMLHAEWPDYASGVFAKALT